MRFRDGSAIGTASNFLQKSEKLQRRPLAVIRQAFVEERLMYHWKSPNDWCRKRRDGRGKSRACSSFSLTSKGMSQGIVMAGQTFISAHYFDVLRRLRENVRRLRPELWQHMNWQLHHDNATSNTSSSPGIFFYQKQDVCRSPPTLLFSVSPVEYKSERHPFWHIWGDRGGIACDAEQPHRTRLPGCILNNGSGVGTVRTLRKGLLRGWWWTLGPKLVFNHLATPVPEIMDVFNCIPRQKIVRMVYVTAASFLGRKKT
jgi:hypothetical protein